MSCRDTRLGTFFKEHAKLRRESEAVRMRKSWYVAILAACLLAVPSASATFVNDNINPDEEFDLYEIYNALFGTGVTAAFGQEFDASDFSQTTDGFADLDSLQLGEAGVFGLIGASGTATFTAIYAANDQRFGYYTDPLGTVDGSSILGTGDYHHLFDVLGDTTINTSGTGLSTSIVDEPYGFYLNSPAESSTTWFSQVSRNSDSKDHFILYSVLNDDGTIDGTRFLLAWEDLTGLQDTDYNDLVVLIEGIVIPEPSTVALLLIGLGGVVMRRRFAA